MVALLRILHPETTCLLWPVHIGPWVVALDRFHSTRKCCPEARNTPIGVVSRNNWSGLISGPVDQIRRVIISPDRLQLVPHGSILKRTKKRCVAPSICVPSAEALCW